MGLRLRGQCDSTSLSFGLTSTSDIFELIDLREATFVTPAALVGVACHAASRRVQGCVVQVLAPMNRDVANYLARSRLAPLLDELGVRHDLPVVRERAADSLWELQTFSRASEVYAFARHIHEQVARALSSGADELFECLCEAGENVGQHSGQQRGYLAAQRYNSGRMLFAVGDAGLGFLHSLERRGAITDGEALQLALEPGVSSVDDRGRGYGLPEMARSLSSMGGSLSILSGQQSVRVTAGGTRTSPPRRASWRGAVVSGMFPSSGGTP